MSEENKTEYVFKALGFVKLFWLSIEIIQGEDMLFIPQDDNIGNDMFKF
jgi:hypothetical protein